MFVIPQTSIAAGLVNEMQSCQGLLDFVEAKLDTVPETYPKGDVEKVRKGVKAYNKYIQNEIVTPGLLQATGGDKAKADEYQKQVDVYKGTLTKQFESRYPQKRLFSDHAIAINNCAKKAVPSGQDLEALKQALNIIVELAKLN